MKQKFNTVRRVFSLLVISLLFCPAGVWAQGSGTRETVQKPQQFARQGKGILRGTVLDKDGLPIPGAMVKVQGATNGAATNARGEYSFEVPANSITVQVSCVSYVTMRISDVNVPAGKRHSLDVVLQDATRELGEVVVTATYRQASASGLYAKQKNMVSMSDGISSDLIKMTSDNNVAQVLKRVSGVTMQESRFVVVRGMSERHNNVQLNGSSLPSTEPNRRNFSFEIIPGNLVDQVVVSKTFTPDMQGEFSGGTVQVNTLSVPAKPFFALTIGSGFNTQTTGKDFFSNTRYTQDRFGGTSRRDWFKNGWTDEYDKAETDEQKGELAAQLPNNWGLKRYKGAPMQTLSLSGGRPFRLKDGGELGFVAAVTYRYEENREDFDWSARFTPAASDDGVKTSAVATLAGLVNIGWKNDKHRVDFNNLYTRRFNHDNSMQTDIDRSNAPEVQFKTASSVRENQLWQRRLSGEHQLFGSLKVDWFADVNTLSREQPEDRYNRATVYEPTHPGEEVAYEWWASYRNEGIPYDAGGIFSSLLKENKKNLGANITFPFHWMGNAHKLKAGYWGAFRTVDYSQANMTLFTTGPVGTHLPAFLPIHERFAPETFASGLNRFDKFSFAPGGTKNGDSYDGTQNIHGAYLMGEFGFFRRLHLIGGARLEDARMEVNTVTRLTNEDGTRRFVDTLMVYPDKQWLPSLTLVCDILPSLKLRAAYSKTVARADFRERSVTSYYDLWERTRISGGELKDGLSKNYDLRLEWYPSAGELISVSAFRKDFTNLIELVCTPSNFGDYAEYTNLQKAGVKGLEFNLRKNFGFVSPALRELYLMGNATLLEGFVEVANNGVAGISEAKRDRPPNGLSPLAWNAALSWESGGGRVGGSLNYNYVDYQIRYAGVDQYHDQYAAARGELSAQVRFKMMKNRMEIKLNADLLNQPHIVYTNPWDSVKDEDGKPITDEIGWIIKKYLNDDIGYNKGDKVLREAIKGRSFSMSIGYSF